MPFLHFATNQPDGYSFINYLFYFDTANLKRKCAAVLRNKSIKEKIVFTT